MTPRFRAEREGVGDLEMLVATRMQERPDAHPVLLMQLLTTNTAGQRRIAGVMRRLRSRRALGRSWPWWARGVPVACCRESSRDVAPDLLTPSGTSGYSALAASATTET